MQREVIKWIQSLDLSTSVQNPKRDLATGHAAAEIVSRCSQGKLIDLQRLPSGASAATKRDVWQQVLTALQKLNCQSVTPQLVDAVLRREPNAALTVLECLYEHFTGHTLPMRGLDAVGTSRNAYVQPTNAASTAKLLAATGDGDSAAHAKGSPAALYDPLASSSPAADGTGAAAKNARNPLLTAQLDKNKASSGAAGEGAAASAPLLLPSTRALQHKLALINNDELAGGANALQAYPRYARPTASTLVHTATGTRRDVVLDRPKYIADESQQRAQNARITQQHAMVRRLQEAAQEEGEEQAGEGEGRWKDPRRSAGTGQDAGLPPPPPHPSSASRPTSAATAAAVGGDGVGKSSTAKRAELPLTTVYRGRFYREPDSKTKASSAVPGGAARRAKASKTAESAVADGGASSLFPAGGVGAEDEYGDHNFSPADAGDGEQLSSSELFHGVGNAGGHGNGSRGVPKLRVQVHSTALKTALALRSGPGQLRERAAALSRELFTKHHYMLRPALSEILADVLSAHKQLEHLLDCCSEDGSGEVLENVLGRLLAHRHAFPLSCMQACWDALSQHVEGIAATLQHTPDEFSYLVESCAFAFSRDAALVPLLVLPSPSSSPNAVTAAVDGHADAAEMPPAEETWSAEREDAEGREKDSEGADAAAATAPAGSSATPPQIRTCPSRPASVFVNARQRLDVAAVLGLVRDIVARLDVVTASYVLRRYVMRAVKPFLLRHGSPAVREAVAEIVSAAFTSTAASEDGEAAFVEFVTSDLRSCVGGVQRERVYWHVFWHAAAAFISNTSSSGEDGPTLPQRPSSPPPSNAAGSGGPLAQCVYDGAVRCLDSSDVDVRTVGVALTMECCARWLPQVRADGECSPDAAAGLTAGKVRALLSRVFCGVEPQLQASEDTSPTPPVSTDSSVWWRTPTQATWELRVMVLRLAIQLLQSGVSVTLQDDNLSGSVEGFTRQRLDSIAADCLATFAGTATTPGDAAAAPTPLWQLQLVLALTVPVVDATYTPAVTAVWKRFVLALPPFALYGGAGTGGGDGVSAHALLARLQFFGASRALVPPRMPLFTPSPQQQQQHQPRFSSSTVPSTQYAESVLSGSRHGRGQQPDSRAVSANGTAAGGRSSAHSTRTQRLITQSAFGDTITSLSNAAEQSAMQQLVCGRVQPVYTVLPLFLTWKTRGALEALLLAPPTDAGKAAAANGSDSLTKPSMMVLAAGALASPSFSSLPSTFPTDVDDDQFRLAVVQHVWPLLEAHGLSAAATTHLHARPPTFVLVQQVLDGEVNTLATMAVALFLRCADDTTVAATVAACGEDWCQLCASAGQWASAVCRSERGY